MSGGDITIVGGGWSVQNMAIDRLCGKVIGVNDAAVYLPHVDIVVSMDRLWTEYRWHWVQVTAVETWLRRSAVQNLDTSAEFAAGWLHVFECDHQSDKFSARKNWLNGMNSGACALNLAWKMQPARVFLLGFDMCRSKEGRAYWHPPYPWVPNTGATSNGKYSTWSRHFRHAAQAFAAIGCTVWNVSPGSAITDFPKMTPAQYLRECKK